MTIPLWALIAVLGITHSLAFYFGGICGINKMADAMRRRL